MYGRYKCNLPEWCNVCSWDPSSSDSRSAEPRLLDILKFTAYETKRACVLRRSPWGPSSRAVEEEEGNENGLKVGHATAASFVATANCAFV
ncbi:hypothetical protein MRX96_002044 [Rhipicephalus microplus]